MKHRRFVQGNGLRFLLLATLSGLLHCWKVLNLDAFVAPPGLKTSRPHPHLSSSNDAFEAEEAHWWVPSTAFTIMALAAITSKRRVQRASAGTGNGQDTSVMDSPVASEELASSDGTVTATLSGSSAKEGVSLQLAFRRMWTKADFLHIHAVTGAVHTLIGLVYLVDILVGDIVQLNGGSWSSHVPFELVIASMLFGAANAVSGLQPALLPRPFDDLLQLLGVGEAGNLQAAGFVNTAAFYFFLTYQSLRVLPSYPAWLAPLDPLFAAVTLLAIYHAIFIIFSWVQRGKLSQGFAIGMSAPLLLNLPVSLHLLVQGQSWVEQLTAVYPGWPEVFFSANYALAWAGSMVTLVLSLYERKVIDITGRLLLTLFLGLITFTVIPLRAMLLVPQWFQGDWMVMLTLNPPAL